MSTLEIVSFLQLRKGLFVVPSCLPTESFERKAGECATHIISGIPFSLEKQQHYRLFCGGFSVVIGGTSMCWC